MEASIYALEDGEGGWAVEFIDAERDGTVEKALFYGSRAEEQARRYIASEYGDVLKRKLQRA